MGTSGPAGTTGPWLRRVFRNTFTYRGERRVVRRWHVKLQHAGRRRTLTLRAPGRAAAAAEAQVLHLRLRTGGWAALEATAPRGDAPGPDAPRPMVRRYTAGLTPGLAHELFLRLGAEGESACFALGTGDANLADLRAAEFQRELGRDGWRHLCLARPREITVAVVWQPNPFLCTYATMLTVPAAQGLPAAPAARGGWPVVVLEEEGGVRRALGAWAAQNPGVASVAAAAAAEALRDAAPAAGAWVLLVRRELAEADGFRPTLAPWEGRVCVLPFGVFAESDDIFASISGVGGGYFLRRRTPDRLLEPLARARPEQGTAVVRRQAGQYVQRLFQDAPPDALPAEAGGLTPRETEVLDLLARGRLDKEVARLLGVSVWTVHSHLRRIFAKYGVHTRTEAVVKHLQK
ncbi:MAG: LuxR C-terminal-related transcriptional regulator [Limisphaerales bacterium]